MKNLFNLKYLKLDLSDNSLGYDSQNCLKYLNV